MVFHRLDDVGLFDSLVNIQVSRFDGVDEIEFPRDCFPCDCFDFFGHCCGKHHCHTLLLCELDFLQNLFDVCSESHIQQRICLIQNQSSEILEKGHNDMSFVCEIVEESSWGSNP